MVEGGGEGWGGGLHHPAPGGGGAAGRRNREVTFNPSSAGSEGARGLGAEQSGALGHDQAPRRGGPGLGGFAGDPRGGAERPKRFSPSLFLEFSSSSDLAREAGLLAVLDKADIEFGCVIQRYSEAIVLFAGGGLV